MNKKTLNLLATCIVVLVVVFVYVKKNTPETKTAFGNNIAVDSTAQVDGQLFANSDTYQEDLLQTIAAQNVAAFERVSESFKKTSSDTLSESIAKDVFSEYLKYNTSGDLDIEALQKITTTSVQNEKANIPMSQAQALIVVPSSVPNLQQYTTQISQLQNALNKKVASLSKYKNQAPYVKNLYATTAKLLLKIPVPENIAQYHLAVINGFENYSGGIALMELQATDPARALLGVQVAQAGNGQIVEGITNLKRIINLNNIVYNKGDVAYAWLLDVADGEKIKTQ